MIIKRKLHIAMICAIYDPKYLGGIQRHMYQLSNLLNSKHNCDVQIFGGKKDSFLERFVWAWQVIWQIIKIHKKQPFDIIHAQAYIAGLPGYILSKLINIPVIFSVHGSHNLDINKYKLVNKVHSNKFSAMIKHHIERFLLTKIAYDKEVSDSENFLEYKNINRDIQVIPNGVDISSKHLKFVKSKNSGYLNLLFVGRLVKIKGLDFLLQALSQVDFDFRLNIVGLGEEFENYQQQIKNLKLNKKALLLGAKYDQDLDKLYQTNDLLILPSLAEGQPLTILEAWSWKLPVLATDVGHNPWTIKDGENGFLAKVGNFESLVEKLNEAYKNKSQLHKMGIAGFKLARKEYSWEKVADRTYGVYREVLRNLK